MAVEAGVDRQALVSVQLVAVEAAHSLARPSAYQAPDMDFVPPCLQVSVF